MIRKDLLRGWLARRHVTLGQVALALDMTPRTLYSRMKKGDFRADEMARMIELTQMTNPSEVFFNFRGPVS